jgi:hypothetical protein
MTAEPADFSRPSYPARCVQAAYAELAQGPLPGGEFLERQLIATAGIFGADDTILHRSGDLSLAPG